MKKSLSFTFVIGFLMACQSPENQFDFWLTDPSSGVLFEKNPALPVSSQEAVTIKIDPETTFQEMDGFGFTLSQGSAQHLLQMSDSARNSLLQ